MNIDAWIEMVLRICNSFVHFYILLTKVSFFWDSESEDMTSSGFCPKKQASQLVDLSGLPIKGLLFWWGNHLNSCPDSYLRKNWLKKICLQKYILYVLSECIIYGLWVYSYIYEYILGPHTLHCILNQFSIWYLWLQHVANQHEL